jgi:hypothetical protein
MVERKRRIPDKRIIITKSIVIIEYKNGCDLMIHRHDARAQAIIKAVSL